MKTRSFLLAAGFVLAITFTFSCSPDEGGGDPSSSSGGEVGNSFSYCLINGQCLNGPFTSKECGDLGGLPSNSCGGSGNPSSSSNGGQGGGGNSFSYCLINGLCLDGPFTSKECGDLGGLPSNSCTGGGGNPSSSSNGGQGGGGSYNLGDTGPGGGIIFYYSEVGFMMTDNNQVCHYLEAAATDMVGLAWATSDFTSTHIEGTASSIGSGRKNTALILATDANAPAAKACKDLTTGGKTDWFLPSRYEMEEISKKRSSVDGGFVTLMGPRYWSSTQMTYNYAETVRPSNSSWYDYKSSLEQYIRCIRAF